MTDQQGDRAATHGGSGGGLGRAAKRLVTLMVAGLLLGACGGGSSAGSQVGTEAGLVDFLDQQIAAFVSVDFEAMHQMQGDGCDFSLEEVTEGFQQVQAFFLAFFGSTLGDSLADTEFEIASFDEESLTAIVTSTYVGDNPALASDDEDPAEFRFVDGSWTSDGDCLGAGVSGFSSEPDIDEESGDVSSDDLRPASEVSAQRDRERSVDVAIGEDFELDDGVVVTVESIRINPGYEVGESWQATHIVEIRAQNSTSDDSSNPEIAIYCAGNEEGGSWFADSTFDLYGDLPAGSFSEGELFLGVPDDQEGVAITPCLDPVVRVSSYGFFTFNDDEPRTADYPAPELPTSTSTSTTLPPATNEQASAGSQVGTETGLVDVLAEVNDSYVSVDFEAMHRMQEDGCDYSLEEVTEGFQQVQAFFLAFFGSTFGDVLADTEFEIASFDEESLTAIVTSTYVGDNPALASDDEDPAEYRFVDGSWTSDGDCLGAGVQAG